MAKITTTTWNWGLPTYGDDFLYITGKFVFYKLGIKKKAKMLNKYPI